MLRLLLLLLVVEPIHQHKLDYLFLECFFKKKSSGSDEPTGRTKSEPVMDDQFVVCS